MRNDKTKPMRVVLLDEQGNPEANGFGGMYVVKQSGPAGFLVQGRARMLYWADEGVTWKRAEEEK